MSAQPCGCDPEAKWMCQRHIEMEHAMLTDMANLLGASPIAPPKVKTDAQTRKTYPLATGCLDYFPDALMEIAHVSYVGNEQHNPNQPLHWDRTKSTDEADALMRHFMERGTLDSDGLRHSAKAAWRALAMLQKEIEASR